VASNHKGYLFLRRNAGSHSKGIHPFECRKQVDTFLKIAVVILPITKKSLIIRPLLMIPTVFLGKTYMIDDSSEPVYSLLPTFDEQTVKDIRSLFANHDSIHDKYNLAFASKS